MASDEEEFPILSSEGKKFDEMSIYELEEYLEELAQEIRKVEKLIETKKKAQNAAESFFKN
ncbi:DUF1192 family protein [Sneathiella sp. P13V-1]|uniref:DUF1192 family protein n=1 Tax=Sneathiella sp. P13V-1 TaxID=2697366 RepID=UPI00187B8575|nr:DUF1192 family protein [Sneathiella sp. P13V-1]MBE7638036.1 DUF1192 family protein [Sneathiella sp. P13V-1]